ncbi:alkaline phosphatase family protein [Micromonospora sp. NPDC047134]|uniref:alkaline phosphatase family protein n=1 Tax=Micromonospora sp. NPDC047134 TaxID=3154340 RepID=UPI00340544CB
MSATDRAVVIGLDGMPYWLLRDLADRGVMPTVAQLLPQGSLRSLMAPVPEISSTSWASFLTGTDPGRHGIYGFIDLLPGGYRTYFPQLPDLRATPFWEAVQNSGAASLILNVPGTYPAADIDGVLVSGFVAPQFDRAVSPARLREPLRNFGYSLDVEVGDAATNPDGFLDRVDAALEARRQAFQYLLAEERWQLAVCVLTETDRVHHFLWRDVMDPTSRLHPRIMDFYRRVDEAIAQIVPYAGDGGLAIVSDHGFGPAHTQLYLNAWLRRAGYLALPADADSLDQIDQDTTAFALDPGRIYLNRRGRFPRGRDLGSVDALLDEMSERLLRLRRAADGSVTEGGEGEQVVAQVLRGAELYHGPWSVDAPDLVAMPALGTQIRGAWTTDELVLPAPFTGTHTRDGATFWCRGDTGSGGVHMRDVAPTVLAMLGLDPIPGMEGIDVRDQQTSTTESRTAEGSNR